MLYPSARTPSYRRRCPKLVWQNGSHWLWFVFPQLRGLGRSAAAEFYGIASLDEARAYLAHPTLGPRLEEATRAVLATQGRTFHAIFGSPDALKFHSSRRVARMGSVS